MNQHIPKRQRAIQLREAGWSIGDIAAALSISQHTVKSYISNTRIAYRNTLHQLARQREHARQRDRSKSTKPKPGDIYRCPGCGGLVGGECQLCKTRSVPATAPTPATPIEQPA